MKRTLKIGALLAVFTIFAAVPAKADSGPTLDYSLSGPVTATWSMSQNPSPFYVNPNIAFAVYSTDLVVDDVPVEDIICFFNTSDWGGVNSETFLPDLVGAQLYSGSEYTPTLQTGVFYLTDDMTGNCYTLTVTQAPEPTTLLLLGSGLAALALKRKRTLVR
jgi:PEP-CTERM motif